MDAILHSKPSICGIRWVFSHHKHVPKDLEKRRQHVQGFESFQFTMHPWFVIMYPSRHNLPKFPNQYLPSEEVWMESPEKTPTRKVFWKTRIMFPFILPPWFEFFNIFQPHVIFDLCPANLNLQPGIMLCFFVEKLHSQEIEGNSTRIVVVVLFDQKYRRVIKLQYFISFEIWVW